MCFFEGLGRWVAASEPAAGEPCRAGDAGGARSGSVDAEEGSEDIICSFVSLMICKIWILLLFSSCNVS